MKWILFLRMVGRSQHGKGFRSYREANTQIKKKKKKVESNSLKGHGLLLTCTHKKNKNTEHGDGDGYFDSRPELTLSRLLINIAIGEWRDPDQMQGRKTLLALTKGSIIA